MKVVFITENSYWERDHHRFGLDLLEENCCDYGNDCDMRYRKVQLSMY